MDLHPNVGRVLNPSNHLPSTLPRAVIALGLVSFFTDLSSEMIYPLLPSFLTVVLGAGALSLGVIEGVAESTAAILKVFSGMFSDRVQRRKPLVLVGYSLSGAARPLIGLAAVWPMVLLLRFADRVGKGLRTSPRDALIADITSPALRGRAYGLHRSMDHAGAVVGPLVAAGLMGMAGLSLRQTFLVAAAPAALAIVTIVFFVREPSSLPVSQTPPTGLGTGWRELGGDYKRVLLALLVFTLGNSTDAFLLLRLTEMGIEASLVAVLWSVHHVVKMASTYLGGRWSDKTGYRRMVVTGWCVYAAVYLAFAVVQSKIGLVIVFLSYGLYFGLTEPAEKAWVANLVPEKLRGTAFGYYHGAIGLGALPASVLFGLVWYGLGAAAAFILGASIAGIAVPILLSTRR